MTVDYERAARFLFDLLDDIDTASDIAKSDNQLYRAIVARTHARRFDVASTDGYSVTFKEGAAELRREINLPE